MQRIERPKLLWLIGMCLAISITVFTVVSAARIIGWMQTPDLAMYDFYLRVLPKDSTTPDRIVIVSITDDDHRNFPDFFSSDTPLANLIKRLADHQAAVIGLDVIRDAANCPDASELDTQLQRANEIKLPVVFSYARDQEESIPAACKRKMAQMGFVDLNTDPDDVARRAIIVADNKMSFAYKIAQDYLKNAQGSNFSDFNAEELRPFSADEGGFNNADDRGEQFLLDYHRSVLPIRENPTYPYKSISLKDVITSDDKLINSTLADVKGKIVLVGYTADLDPDVLRTPIQNRMCGVTLWANAIDQLLRIKLDGARPRTAWKKYVEYSWILVFSLAGGALPALRPRLIVFVCVIVLGIVGLGFTGYWLMYMGRWVPVAAPAMVWIGSAGLSAAYVAYWESKIIDDRDRPADFVGVTKSDRREPISVPTRRIPMATVLFSDIKKFAARSEAMEPTLLMQWLNLYLEQMSDCVAQNGGIVTSFIGDSVMAAFGVLDRGADDKEHAKENAANAIRCAISMRETTRTLNQTYRTYNLPEIESRIGIYSGPVAAGMVGNKSATQYTLIGNTVNIASRLESFDKQNVNKSNSVDGCRILVGKPTRDLVANRFDLPSLGVVELPSITKQKIEVFAVV
jgi:adenylate cyclase